MKKVYWMGFGTLALAAMSLAAPLCSSGPVTINSLEVNGCSLGAVTFSNFSFLNANATVGGAVVLPTDLNVLVNIAYNSPNVALTFTPSVASNWVLNASNEQFSFQVNYTVTTPFPFFLSYRANVAGAGTGTGNFSLTKSIPGNVTAGADQTNNNSPIIPFVGAPVSTFNVSDNIQNASGTSGTATLTSVTNSFLTPEPMTSLLLGSGLMAFGLMLRRKRG